MDLQFKTPEQIADEYLLHLKALKPSVNERQTDSDWWVRSRVVGGTISGVYADVRKISEDAFPQSARREAVEKHLYTYFNDGFKQATISNGFGIFTGEDGSAIPTGTQAVYSPNGNAYVTTEDGVIAGGVATVALQSISTGQAQNLLGGAELTISNPPSGIDPVVTIGEDGMRDGSDIESTQDGANRVLARVREPLKGGTQEDYRQWAIDSDDSVVSVNILRYPQGFGSVGIVVSAGTKDIDSALDNNLPISVLPSSVLIQKIQDYIDSKRPLTDYAVVFQPNLIEIDVTVAVKLKQGNLSTILAGQTLTQEELVQREVKRAIYKTPAGGEQIDGDGFVLKSRIEEYLDVGLAAQDPTVGKIEMLLDRQVLNLDGLNANVAILNNQIPIPGVITVTEL